MRLILSLCCCLSLSIPAVAATAVTVTTIEGKTVKGELVGISKDEVKLKAESEETTIKLDQVLSVKVGKPAAGGATKTAGFADSSQLDFTVFTAKEKTATITTASLGKLEVPIASVRTVRFSTSADAKLAKSWANLLDRSFKKDVIVVNRKAGVLDFVEGVIGDIDAGSVKFLLGDSELPVKKEKLYGIIYARGNVKGSPLAKLSLGGDQSVQVSSISLEGDSLKVKLLAGADTKIPLASVGSIDFSSQRMKFLSQLEPRTVKYTYKYGDGDAADKWLIRYRKDQKIGPAPLKIREKIYRHGLWLHPDTRLSYRLNRDYKKFRAVAGIDADVAAKGGAVQLTILGDGKILFQDLVKGADDPKQLDFDVSKIRDLEIHVGFSNPKFPLALDGQLVLGDAKVLK